MSSKFAPDIPKSLIDAVSSVLGEAKIEPAKPDPEAVARKKKLDALRDKQEADKAEKGENKPAGVRKVAGHQYGGAKQKDEPEQHDEELKGNQHKIDANKNGKIDAHDFKILRGKKKANEEIEQIDEYGHDSKPVVSTPKPVGKSGVPSTFDKSKLKPASQIKPIKTEQVDERELTPGEAEKKEKYVKSMKKGLAGFKARYGSKAKNVMYATATKMAKNEETVTEAIVNHEDIAKHLIKKHGKDVSMDHIEDAIDGMDDAHKVDKREVLYHINKLTKEEVQIDEGKMKDIYTSMMHHADKKGYTSHKQFTPADYDTVGKEYGISGKELAVIAGHKTAAKAAEESFKPEIAKGFPARGVKTQLPFTPDKNAKKIATAGKYGYGPSAAKHLAKQGMKSVKEETVEEGTGGPIYPKPFIKLGDLIARAKDMRNIKQATIVTPKDENEVKIKKEEAEQVDETMMGKAGCTSEDDKKKAEKPVDYDKPTFLRKVNDWRKSNPKFQPKKLPMSKAAGALAAEELVYEDEVEQIDEAKTKQHIYNVNVKYPGSNGLDTYQQHRVTVNRGDDEHGRVKAAVAKHYGEKKHDVVRITKAQFSHKNPDYNKGISEAKEEVELDESAGDKLLRAANEYKQSSPEYHKRMIKYHDHMADVHYDNKQKRSEHEENIRHHESELTKLKEEIEQIQEIGDTKAGKQRLIGYIKKASNPSYEKSNVNLSSRAASKLAADDGKDDGEKDDRKAYMRSKGIQRAADRLNKEEVELDEAGMPASIIRQKETMRQMSDKEFAEKHGNMTDTQLRTMAAHHGYGWNKATKTGSDHYVKRVAAGKIRSEEVELDETAVLDKYIRSMGYDPQHLDKNKKVMFAKTNAFKTYASSQRTEALYDGGQKGTQDIDTHMSPGVTARGK